MDGLSDFLIALRFRHYCVNIFKTNAFLKVKLSWLSWINLYNGNN